MLKNKHLLLIVITLLVLSIFSNLLLYNQNSKIHGYYKGLLQKEVFNSIVKIHTVMENLIANSEKKKLTNKEAVILSMSYFERLLGFNYSGEGILDEYINKISQNKEIVSIIRDNLMYVAHYIDRQYQLGNYDYFELSKLERINEYIKLVAHFLDPQSTVSVSSKEIYNSSISFNGFIRELEVAEEFKGI